MNINGTQMVLTSWGMQPADINPALPGVTTQQLAKPAISMGTETEARETLELATGKTVKKLSPIMFLFVVAGILALLGYLQTR